MTVFENNAHSTHTLYETCYMINIEKNTGYTNEPFNAYKNLNEPELNEMSLAYAEKSFSEGWDIENQEENEYWNSF